MKEHTMSTNTLHSGGQHSRRTLSALGVLLAAALRSPLKAAQSAPALTRAEAAAREAEAVRNLAYSYSKTDPGFAADLYAAADRHEGLYVD
jgi:hypothetical protein